MKINERLDAYFVRRQRNDENRRAVSKVYREVEEILDRPEGSISQTEKTVAALAVAATICGTVSLGEAYSHLVVPVIQNFHP